jgi:hypothetical protein
MREVYTDIDIDAPAEHVWRILIDIERWREWNPFIPEISGDVSVGSKLRVRIEPPGGKAMTFKPTVSCVTENRDFIWAGSLPIPGAFRGEHIFELRPIDNSRTKVIHKEEFHGWMLLFLWKSLDTGARAGFHLMNEALKKEAERADG